MGYSVPSLTMTRDYVIANGVALLLAYAMNYLSQIIAMCCYDTDSKQQTVVFERLLEVSRTLYWFGVATAFSVFPPFYYGMHSVGLGWLTLIFVVLMHILCFVKRCDGQRSLWSYIYFFFHASIFVWIVVALIVGYAWSKQQPQASDTNEM